MLSVILYLDYCAGWPRVRAFWFFCAFSVKTVVSGVRQNCQMVLIILGHLYGSAPNTTWVTATHSKSSLSLGFLLDLGLPLSRLGLRSVLLRRRLGVLLGSKNFPLYPAHQHVRQRNGLVRSTCRSTGGPCLFSFLWLWRRCRLCSSCPWACWAFFGVCSSSSVAGRVF